MRKKYSKIFIVTSLSLCALSGSAFAATQDPGFGSWLMDFVSGVIVDPAKWLNTIWQTVEKAQLSKYIEAFSAALLLTGIIWSGLRIVTLGGTVEIQGFLVRSLIAGALVLSGPWMGQLLRDEWTACYQWGHDNLSKTVTDDAINQLTALNVTMAGLSVVYIGAPIVTEIAHVAAGKDFDEATKDAGIGVRNNASQIFELVKYVVLSVSLIVTVEYLVVILSGFAIIIASLVIPLAGVLLIFPGNALQSWFATWLKSASAAILIVLLHPIAYVAAMTIGFIEPAKRFNTALDGAATQLNSSFQKLNALIPNGNPTQALDYIKNFYGNATGAVGDLAGSATTLLFGMIASIVMLFVGIAFAVMFVAAAQAQIQAFIGSIVGGGGKAGAGGAFAGVGGAGLALAGGAAATAGSFFGGGSSSSTPGGGGGTNPGGGGDGSSPSGGGMSDAEAQQIINADTAAEDQEWASYANGGPTPRSPMGGSGGGASSSAGGSSGASAGAAEAGGAAAEGVTAAEVAETAVVVLAPIGL